MVSGADDASITRIARRSEGMPLYAVEMIRMLADRGVLQVAQGSYELVSELGELDVPETLHALIASRLDGLGQEDRSLLQDAAVLGQSFTLESLAAVTGQAAGSIESRVRDLTHREFLVQETDPRSPERGQYAFVQGIIREIAYGMLSKADRRSRHLAVAHHFEALGDDELAGAVASHYVQALRATANGPDREALSARARDWLAQAADRATELGSPEQALVLGEQALEITPAGEERVAILQGAALAAKDALRQDRQIAYLREVVALLGDLGEVDSQVAALGVLGSALGDIDRVDELREVVEQMRARIGSTDDVLAHAEYDQAIAYLSFFDEDLDGSLAALDRSAAGFEKARAWERCRKALVNRTNVLTSLGRHQEANTLRRGMLATAMEENDLQTAAQVMVGLATESLEWAEALEQSLEAATIARRIGSGRTEMVALANAAEFAVESGAWAKADELLDDLQSRPGLPAELSDAVLLDAALLAAYRGDHAGARAAMERVSPSTSESLNPTSLAWYRRVQSVLLLMAGELSGAFDEAVGAVDAEAVEGPNTTMAAYFAGRAALWLGDAVKAQQALNRMPAEERGWHGSIRRALEAGINAIEGHPRDAAVVLDTVLAGRLANRDRFTHAMLTLDAVAVLPVDLVPEGAVDAAGTYLEQLGAAALLARLSRANVRA
jgi:tetratricopeptide (TPR) repeat protein